MAGCEDEILFMSRTRLPTIGRLCCNRGSMSRPCQRRLAEWIMGKRVLLVEDDASVARTVVEGLSDEGFAVSHAADGDAAREALHAGGWDFVILDWWLPGPDGLEVLEGHHREGGRTPVLFLTARDAVSDRVRGLDGGRA
jgi:CheY-like chemotaxis protein